MSREDFLLEVSESIEFKSAFGSCFRRFQDAFNKVSADISDGL